MPFAQEILLLLLLLLNVGADEHTHISYKPFQL